MSKKIINNSDLERYVEMIGYNNLEDYFGLNWKKTFVQMAEELGTTYQRVSKEYQKFLRRAE